MSMRIDATTGGTVSAKVPVRGNRRFGAARVCIEDPVAHYALTVGQADARRASGALALCHPAAATLASANPFPPKMPEGRRRGGWPSPRTRPLLLALSSGGTGGGDRIQRSHSSRAGRGRPKAPSVFCGPAGQESDVTDLAGLICQRGKAHGTPEPRPRHSSGRREEEGRGRKRRKQQWPVVSIWSASATNKTAAHLTSFLTSWWLVHRADVQECCGSGSRQATFSPLPPPHCCCCCCCCRVDVVVLRSRVLELPRPAWERRVPPHPPASSAAAATNRAPYVCACALAKR